MRNKLVHKCEEEERAGGREERERAEGDQEEAGGEPGGQEEVGGQGGQEEVGGQGGQEEVRGLPEDRGKARGWTGGSRTGGGREEGGRLRRTVCEGQEDAGEAGEEE
jgi:hypothetical protein